MSTITEQNANSGVGQRRLDPERCFDVLTMAGNFVFSDAGYSSFLFGLDRHAVIDLLETYGTVKDVSVE